MMQLLSSTPRLVQWVSTLVWDTSQFLFVYGTAWDWDNLEYVCACIRVR